MVSEIGKNPSYKFSLAALQHVIAPSATYQTSITISRSRHTEARQTNPQALRSNCDRYRHWKTRFYDYCLLEGYRNSSKNRLTETADHYIAVKRPFELAVLRNAIPATEWNTLSDAITSKVPNEDAGKPWLWLQNSITLVQILWCKTDTISGRKCHK